jgi:hypothetical protein
VENYRYTVEKERKTQKKEKRSAGQIQERKPFLKTGSGFSPVLYPKSGKVRKTRL